MKVLQLAAAVRPWAWRISGLVVSLGLILFLRDRLRTWWGGRKKVDQLLAFAAVTFLALVPLALGFIVDNPGADANASVANEQRKTVVQIVGGLLGAGVLLFSALRAIQTERQIREAEKQRETQENLKFEELRQSRWHNALDLLGKGTEKEPQLESRVAAILMLSSLELPKKEEQRLVLETICHYVRIHAKAPDLGNERRGDEEEEPDPPPRADIECCCGTLQRMTHGSGSAQPMNLRGAFLPGVNLQNSVLSEWHLQEAVLRNADLRGAKLDGAKLDSANLSGATLDGTTTMKGASLKNCWLLGTIARGVDFSGVDLRGIHIGPGTDLSGCRFDGANLAGVNLSQGNTEGADFTKAKGYTPTPVAAEREADVGPPPETVEEILQTDEGS